MIILSAGMPRAGSGWYYNLANDLCITGGCQDGREIRQRYRLGNILTEVNCNIGALTARRLLMVLVPSLLGNTFVIKAHAGPTPFALRLIRWGWMLPTYIYRDPRDAMLSAYEYGQRGLNAGSSNAFSHLSDFAKSLEFILEYCHTWEKWIACEEALHTRYEALKTDYNTETDRLVYHLGLNSGDPRIQETIAKHSPGLAAPGKKGTHFSKGISGRYREAYTEGEQMILKEKLGPYLDKMGYR